MIWDSTSEFEKELINFTYHAESDKIIVFVLVIHNVLVYNISLIIALGLNQNRTTLYHLKHGTWAHQKEGNWQTIGVNARIVQEQQGLMRESNTFEAQDICLDAEQNIWCFEIHPNEKPETVITYVGKGCACI